MPAVSSRAFPNAYLDTDETPRHFPWRRVAAVVGASGVAYFGLTILALSIFDGDYSPISQAASEYGVGRFAAEMNLGFLVGGIGFLAFAWAVSKKESVIGSRAVAVLLFIAGLVLIMNSYFTTNPEGAPATLHGTIHGFGGLIFFITAPLAVVLLSRRFGRGAMVVTVACLALGFALLGAGAGLGGLAERVILLVIFTGVVIGSLVQAGLAL